MLTGGPAKALVRAEVQGLRALAVLLKSRVNQNTKSLSEDAESRLSEALESWERSVDNWQPYFTSVTQIERRLRDIELQNIWETTAAYGNIEWKRVRSEKDGVVGPLNLLINIFGARLRDYFLLMYPFPTPVRVSQQKSKTIWGYDDNRVGLVPVSHGRDLPELDFADMIRSHGRELCRQGFISRVTPASFNAFCFLLIRRLSPFVDHVYTAGECGDRGFLWRKKQNVPTATSILRSLVFEMASTHGMRSTPIPSPSRASLSRSTGPRSTFFEDQVAKLRDEGSGHYSEPMWIREIWADLIIKLSSGKRPILGEKDVAYLHREARNQARWEGIRRHSLVTDGLPQPVSVESAVKRGHGFLEKGESVLIAGETRVATPRGKGRADLTVYVRTTLKDPNRPGTLQVMKPVAVFDLKSRTAFDWEVRARKSTGKRQKTVPRLPIRKRMMNREEWVEGLAEVPDRRDLDQLRPYAKGICREYARVTGDEIKGGLLKGIILLDTQYDSTLAREIAVQLVRHVWLGNMEESKVADCDRVIVRPKNIEGAHVALVLHKPQEAYQSLLKLKKRAADSPQAYNPFPKQSAKPLSRHVLYVGVSSSNPSGFTSSWLASYWHGLQFVHQMAEENEHTRILWLDLAGLFGNRSLAKTRLRIDEHSPRVQAFFESVEIVDLSASVNGFLFEGVDAPNLGKLLSKDTASSEERIVVVTGWDWIRRSTPYRLRTALRELKRYLVETLTKSTATTVWFDRGHNDERTSAVYHRNCVLPFSEFSPHRGRVTEIVWNLPVRPYASTHLTPMYDDLRVIIRQTADSVEKEMIHVPMLENWSLRFWSRKYKQKPVKPRVGSGKGRPALSATDVLNDEALRNELIDTSTDLVPWLRTLWPSEFTNLPQPLSIPVEIGVIPVSGPVSKRTGVLSRMTYRKRLKGLGGARGYVAETDLVPKVEITHPRHYRSCRRKDRPTRNAQTYRSPDEEYLEFKGLPLQTARNVEMRRLRQAVKLLSDGVRGWGNGVAWEEFLRRLELLIPQRTTDVEIESLNQAFEFFNADDLSKDLWEFLLWTRDNRLGIGLQGEAEERLKELLEGRPYLSSVFGNYLFLLILAVTRRYEGLSLENVRTLWDSVKSWQLTQLGFKFQNPAGDLGRPKYDTRAIWANLCKRAKVMSRTPRPTQEQIRYGRALVVPADEGIDHWVFIQDQFDPERLHIGLWTSVNPLGVSSTPRWTESNHKTIARLAADAKPEESYDVLVARVEGVEYLWLFAEDEWNLMGSLTIIPRKKRAVTSIRGLQIGPVSPEDVPALPVGIRFPKKLRERVQKTLRDIAALREQVVSVRCVLETEDEMYRVRFENEEGATLGTLTFSRTADLLALLRRPLVDGVPLQSSQNSGLYFTWNPYEDIDYGELQILRPYVERKRPYVNVRVPLPLTCAELVAQRPRVRDATLAHDVNECPIADGSADAHGLCWRIRVGGKTKGTPLELLNSTLLSDHDVSSLIKAKQLFVEGARYKLNIKCEVDPDEREGVVFRESWRIARALGKKPVRAGAFLDLDTEQLKVVLTDYKDGIQITVYSTTTGERVSSAQIVPPKGKTWDIDKVMEGFIEDTEAFIESYFGDDKKAQDRIEGYEEMLDGVREKLRRIRRGLPPLR